jgi:hypothetical protein
VEVLPPKTQRLTVTMFESDLKKVIKENENFWVRIQAKLTIYLSYWNNV